MRGGNVTDTPAWTISRQLGAIKHLLLIGENFNVWLHIDMGAVPENCWWGRWTRWERKRDIWLTKWPKNLSVGLMIFERTFAIKDCDGSMWYWVQIRENIAFEVAFKHLFQRIRHGQSLKMIAGFDVMGSLYVTIEKFKGLWQEREIIIDLMIHDEKEMMSSLVSSDTAAKSSFNWQSKLWSLNSQHLHH
jgi:hypothetical protein